MQFTDLSQAIDATEAFVQVLLAEGQAVWVERFTVIADALKVGDVRSAVHSFKNCSYAGPGSLSDVFAKDESSFNLAWGNCSKSIRALAEA